MICFIRRSTRALRILFTSDFICVQSFFIKCVERAKKREQSSNGRFIWDAIHLTVIQPLTFAVRIIREWEILTESQLLGKRVVNSRQIGCSICWNDYHVCWHNCRIISKIYFSNSKNSCDKYAYNLCAILIWQTFLAASSIPNRGRLFHLNFNEISPIFLFISLSFLLSSFSIALILTFASRQPHSFSLSHPGRSQTPTKSSHIPAKFSHDHKNKHTYKHQSH